MGKLSKEYKENLFKLYQSSIMSQPDVLDDPIGKISTTLILQQSQPKTKRIRLADLKYSAYQDMYTFDDGSRMTGEIARMIAKDGYVLVPESPLSQMFNHNKKDVPKDRLVKQTKRTFDL